MERPNRLVGSLERDIERLRREQPHMFHRSGEPRFGSRASILVEMLRAAREAVAREAASQGAT